MCRSVYWLVSLIVRTILMHLFIADDQQYYRAVVTKSDGTSCQVYFLDYGNYNQLPVKGLKELPESMSIEKIPGQAVPVRGADSDVKKKLNQFLTSGELIKGAVKNLEAVTGIYTVSA